MTISFSVAILVNRGKYLIENCKSVNIVEWVRDGIESAVAEQEKSHHRDTDGYTVEWRQVLARVLNMDDF